MQNQINPNLNQIAPTTVKCFWVLDATEKAYFKREQIKGCGGYFVREHSAWCIDNPSENARNFLTETCGLVLQFRKYKGNEL